MLIIYDGQRHETLATSKHGFDEARAFFSDAFVEPISRRKGGWGDDSMDSDMEGIMIGIGEENPPRKFHFILK